LATNFHQLSAKEKEDMAVIRAAVIQDAPVVFDPEATIKKIARLTAEAAKDGAELVLFPEAFVSAYPKGLDFGARLGVRKPEGRVDFRRYYESSIDVPGPHTHRLGEIAKENNVHLVLGVMEREQGTIYCTVLFFSPAGELMGKHRKLMPTALERLVWGFGDGSTMQVFDTPVGRMGAVICWENYMPLLRTYMYSQGIQIYCAPTADDRDTWLPTMQHIAMEGRCFVISCCQYLLRSDCPEDFDTIMGDDPDTILMRGGSCIVNPLGQVLAGPNFEGPCILTADLNLDEIAEGKYDMDCVGHYARPDVFRLHVNLSKNPPVQTWEDAQGSPFKK
jgi:nitrilase